MRVIVLGGGVIGVTSAWYLAAAGHDVKVVERQSGPGLETSFANAGEISPGYASPWAAPGIVQKAVKWLLMDHPPLILRPQLDRKMLAWLLAMLRNCTGRRYAVNKARMVRLAEYSRDEMIALRAKTSIVYDQRMQGTLQLFRTQEQIDAMGKDIAVLQSAGVPFDILDSAGCVAAEPGLLSSQHKIAGGLRLLNDETGDCHLFTTALADMAAAIGVEFVYGTKILGLESNGGRVTGASTSRGVFTADRYVVALGSHSAAMLLPLGVKLPVYPVKGYSITVPITDVARAPVSTLMDETYKIAITRLGTRIRVGGMAEISGYNDVLPEARRTTLVYSVNDLFPGAGDLAAATFWSGLRPMTPDGTPVIGSTPYGNLFLNTGHGTLGWTMACGSGQLIADLIGDRTPALPASDYSLARYAS